MKKIIQLLLVVCCLVGCTSSIQSTNLMENVKSNSIEKIELDQKFMDQQINFSVELFKKSYLNENTLVSPLSVMLALSMVSNGADSDTLKELEKVLGNTLTIQELNQYLYSYMDSLNNDQLKISNAIWFKDSEHLRIEENFLQINADYYLADIYKSKFDESTIQDINTWANNKTNGMIKEVIKKLDPQVIMILLNAIAFDAKWEEAYEKKQIVNRDFTNIDNKKQEVEMLVSTEKYYLENENVKGFIKDYKGKKYSFVGILPNEDISINDYIQSLTSEKIQELLNSKQRVDVDVEIPKFEFEQEINLNKILKDLGIKMAFDSNNADFSRLGTSEHGNIYIGDVSHKTYISLDENGTKAAAITIIQMNEKASFMQNYEVRLNRPFVFMILDNENNIPVFIGAVTDL